jgi:hypothetical protein
MLLVSSLLVVETNIVLCMQPKFLEQDSCLTFCSHKVDNTVRFYMFLSSMCNLIISSYFFLILP